MNLPVLIDSQLLPISEWNDLASMSEELTKAYETRQVFRTETEARVSVLDDIHHPTKASKYWQAIREQAVMLEQLALLSFDYRRNEVAIRRHTKTIAESTDEFAVEEASIGMDECLFKRASMKSVAIDRNREIKMWSMLKKELDDGTFDKEDVNSHQLVSYTTQFAIMASTIDKSQMSGAEYANLQGQLITSLQRCRDQGVLTQLQAALPERVAHQLAPMLALGR